VPLLPLALLRARGLLNMWRYPYRKSWETIGYSFDADTYCLNCAYAIYGESVSDIESTDRSGDPIYPIFLDSEFTRHDVCGACHIRMTDL
jgi:hypothetical protein